MIRRRKKSEPEKIGAVVSNLLADRGYLTFCREFEITTQWKSIVGSHIAEQTECDRVEEGIVYVRVANAAWRHELLYVKQLLLQKIKNHCNTIRDIVFI